MSERQPNSHESGLSAEFDPRDFEKINDAAAEQRRAAAEKAAEKLKANQAELDKIRETIDKTAPSSESIKANRLEKPAEESVLRASGQLKGLAYKQKIREVQRKETPATRTFSKIVHQPVVEEISTIAEGTIARPSGLLVGGIVSVISSVVILYISRHYGYEYNFLVGLIGFAGGFVLGLLLEGAWRIFKPRHH